MSLKELSIRDYISKINFKTDNWTYHILEEDMKKFLGERPALEVIYQKDVMVNEVSGESKEIEKISKVSIIFTDLDMKIKKLEILI